MVASIKSAFARKVAAAIVGIACIVCVLGLAGCGSNYPEGVDTDAFEVRSVTWSYGDYEVLTYDDKHFVLPAEGTEVYELADSGRDFLSRDEKTLWLKGDTVDRLGLENLEVIGESADEAADDAAGEKQS